MRQTGGHGDRIAGQGAGLIDGPQRGEVFHDGAFAAERAYRHAAAHDFAQAGEVRFDIIVTLGTGQPQAKTGHHLVQHQNTVVLVALFAQGFQKAGYRRDAVHITRHRLDDNTGNLVTDLSKCLFDAFDVVVGQRDRVLGQVGGHAGGAGYTHG